MSAPDHRETGRRRKETGTWQRGDRLFPRIDQVRVNFVFIREWAHALHPVLALQRNVKIGRDVICHQCGNSNADRSEEHTSELQSLMRISYAVFCLKKHKSTKHN